MDEHEMTANFEANCNGIWQPVRRVTMHCSSPQDGHGHFILACEDGLGFLNFPVSSLAGVNWLIAEFGMKQEDADIVKALQTCAQTLLLPLHLTQSESDQIALYSSGKLKLLYGFWSP